ncbi:uncharacterized protein F5147DRAFT_652402 [Suillus discolor]|uniref:Uncharacterized protein n=1 Tax=Suillus discolor TaxID=1912936 RepID=A0A9P7F728_9AGAM|nr:uncharacterized protein F5147DRAFT_652402 [Suillus discolor]KAG2109309.1 hypothetical protein F5147DRAFT_652402 [Suillus discolor]
MFTGKWTTRYLEEIGIEDDETMFAILDHGRCIDERLNGMLQEAKRPNLVEKYSVIQALRNFWKKRKIARIPENRTALGVGNFGLHMNYLSSDFGIKFGSLSLVIVVVKAQLECLFFSPIVPDDSRLHSALHGLNSCLYTLVTYESENVRGMATPGPCQRFLPGTIDVRPSLNPQSVQIEEKKERKSGFSQ